MSGIMEELVAALKENTATLKALSGKTADAATAKAPAKATATTRAAVAKDEDGEEPKRGRGRPPKAKTLSATEMGEKAREFCEAAGDDEDEFKDRRSLVSKLAKKYGVAKFSEISGADDQTAALEAIADYADAGGAEGGEEGDY